MKPANPAAGEIGPRGPRPPDRPRNRPAGMPVPAPASHRELLGMTLGIRRAAAAADRAAVHRDLRRFRAALDEHLRAEQADQERLACPARELVRDGQERLVTLVDDMLAGTGPCASGCNCIVRMAELRTALGRQARLETGLLVDRPRARTRRRPPRRSRRRP